MQKIQVLSDRDSFIFDEIHLFSKKETEFLVKSYSLRIHIKFKRDLINYIKS